MKRFFALLLIVISPAVMSASKVDLSQVTPATAIQLYYAELSRNDFVIDPQIFEDKRVLSFRSTNIGKPAFKKLLASLGYRLREDSGVDFIEKTEDQSTDLRVFRPKNRPANYLLRQTQGLLPGVKIANQRTLQQTGSQTTTADVPEGSAAALISQPSDVIVYSGRLQDLQAAKEIFEQLDTVPQTRFLKVLILEFAHEKNTDDALSAISDAAQKTGLSFDTNAGSIGFSTGSFSALLKMISTDSRFRFLSNPSLSLTSGETTRFVVGDSVPTLGGTTTTGTGASTQEIVYVDSGVVLSVLPQISGNTTQLKIRQQLSSFVRTQTGISSTPTLKKREVETTANMKDGEVVALAGLRSSGETKLGRSFFGFSVGSGHTQEESEILVIFQLEQTPQS